MKLSSPFPLVHFLFPAFCLAWISAGAFAQAPGQATIKLRTGQVQQGTILGVTSAGVELQFGANKAAFPVNMIAEVQMAPPPELARAQQAYRAGDYEKALIAARSVADKYKGLPTIWAQLATGLVGDIYVAQNDLTRAEAAYRDFQKLYPGAGAAQADVGMARIALSNDDLDTARRKVEPITTAALKQKNVPAGNALAYSQAFLVLGKIKEAEGDLPGALEEYLRTVTLFYHDPVAAAAAQDRAQALRLAAKQSQQTIAVP